MRTYLLLLHKLGVRAVIDDVLAKDGSSQDGVDLLGVDVADLAVEDKIVAGGADADGGLAAEQDKGKNIAVLFAVLAEETRGVHAVSDGAADDGEPVEDDGGFMGILEEGLIEDVEEDDENDGADEADADLGAEAELCVLLDQRHQEVLEGAHCSLGESRARRGMKRGT